MAKERNLKQNRERYIYLYKAIMTLRTKDECERFLADLLTPLELTECANRWAIASLLIDGLTQAEVAKLLGVSSTTVSRVNACLQRGEGGYRMIWERRRKKAVARAGKG